MAGKIKVLGLNFGRINGEYVINPTPAQMEESDIHLTVAGTKYAVNMVEAGAKEVSEEQLQTNDGAASKILAVTSCPTGIAHTYMAAEGLEKAAAKAGCRIKIETRGSGGAKNVLTDQEIADADCIIVAAPVYVLGPVGQLKDFVDRFGPAHDKAYMLFENAKREDTEGDVPLEKRCLKRHLVSYISIGGAATDHWVSFGLNQLNLFGMSINMKVVDQMNAHGMWRSQELTDQTVADAKHMGRRIVEAYSKKNS